MKRVSYRVIAACIFFLLLTLLDRMTKSAAVSLLKDQADVILLPGILRLTYVENYGAAFGSLQNRSVFLIAVTSLLLVYILAVYIRLLKEENFRILRILCIAILAGGIGNLIDRLTTRFVVDFIYFDLINFPVFNAADCYVTCSVFLFAVLLFTLYKNEDLDGILLPFFSSKKKN